MKKHILEPNQALFFLNYAISSAYIKMYLNKKGGSYDQKSDIIRT